MDAPFSNAPYAPILLWTIAGLLATGLFSAVLTRRTEGSTWQTFAQWLFFALLGLVGSVAILSSLLGPGCWAASSATLTVMVLAATYEPRRSGQQMVS